MLFVLVKNIVFPAIFLAALLLIWAMPAAADMVVAARTIPARSVIAPEDLAMQEGEAVGAVTDPAQLIGQEALVALYAGRPIRLADVGPPAVVERNAVIPLIYQSGGLTISTEGRAMDRASPGDLIRVMNLSSRTTVTARIDETGAAHVSY